MTGALSLGGLGTDSDAGPSAERPLLMLAMDHRASFGSTLFGVVGAPTSEQTQRMQHAKALVYAGLLAAAPQLSAGLPGVLVDESLGAAVAARARRDGVVLAVPVERSGRDRFELEYGTPAATREHVAALDPDYVKVLVRMNPADRLRDRQAQLHALAELSGWLDEVRLPLLYELLVPATAGQLASVDGDAAAYDRELRPELVVEVIAQHHVAGVEPAIWKVEGLETATAARGVVAAARSGGRGSVDCVVLGRDAPRSRLDHWLRVAAGVEGFVGFAIGRSIWQAPLRRFQADGDEDRMISGVATRYLEYSWLYLRSAEGGDD